MASSSRHPLLQYLRKLTGAPGVRELTDCQLLKRFAAERDEAAFDALVQRHGPMVWGVCRRILHQESDADDAFQATFLVLARKAGSLRWPESVGGWLHRVAHRVALKARVQAARRSERERSAASARAADAMAEITGRELQQVLDEELLRLPARYRAPLVLCYLEGKTRDEAAEELGWTVGSVKGRLERGRQLLEMRLARRGLAFSTALLATALASSSAAAAPATLQAAAVQLAAGAGTAPPTVLALAEGAMQALFLARLKIVLAAALLIGIVSGGAGVGIYRAAAARQTTPGSDMDMSLIAAVEPDALLPVQTPVVPPEPIETPRPAPPEDRRPAAESERSSARPDGDRRQEKGPRDEGRKPRSSLRATVIAVNEAERSITLHFKEGERRLERTLPLAADAQVQLVDDWGIEGREGAREGKLADLSEGLAVQAALSTDERTIVRLQAGPILVRGTLKAVNLDDRALTITAEGRDQMYAVAPAARVTIDNQLRTFAELKPGLPIQLRLLVDRKQASHVIQSRFRDGDREK
jgi:RNA polymerase sigma factor (sigma-70 family)